jgi:uncharacterized protein
MCPSSSRISRLVDGQLADPDEALRRADRPRLIDEWQEVPEVLAAVKRTVDNDRTPGQFILTGSIRATANPSTARTW